MNESYGANIAQNQSVDMQEPRPMTEAAGLVSGRGPNLARQVTIQQLNHGYIINVGCQAFAIENQHALLHRLSMYLADPQKTEENWLSGNLKF